MGQMTSVGQLPFWQKIIATLYKVNVTVLGLV